MATFNTISTNEQVFHGTMASAKATGTGNGYLGGKIRLTLTNTGVPANGSVIIRVYERSTWIPNSIIGATQKKTLTIGDPSYVFEVSPWPSASKYYRKCTSSTFNVTKGKYYIYWVNHTMSSSLVSGGQGAATMTNESFSAGVCN